MTAQAKDTIVIDGVRGHLLGTPLDALLEAQPASVPRPVGVVTTHHRGYVAAWHVDADVLFLDQVDATVPSGPGLYDWQWVGADVVLPGLTLPAKASWVSGVLAVGIGDVTYHDSMYMVWTYAREIHLHVVQGNVAEVSWPTERTTAT